MTFLDTGASKTDSVKFVLDGYFESLPESKGK